MLLRSLASMLAALLGCAPAPAATGLALRDPYTLIDDVYDSGHTLQLLVLPDAYACDPASGLTAPEVPDVPIGETPDAVVDLSIARADTAGFSVDVPAGRWTVLARGKGTDIVSGRMNVFIASGCATTEVAPGGTVAVMIMLQRITGTGVCGDGLLSPDEQCEGEPDCASCRTVAETLNTTTSGVQDAPRIAARPGQRPVVVFSSSMTTIDVRLRLFDPNGRPLVGLGPLAVDESLDNAAAALPGNQTHASAAVAPDGRFAVAFVDYGRGDPDVRVAFFDTNRNFMGPFAGVRADAAMSQEHPAIAFDAAGAAMVVFEDARASTGLSGRVFAAGAVAPSGAEAFTVGTGRTGASAPQVAGLGSGFVVVFEAGGDVLLQRFGADGAPTDATAQPVASAGGTRSQPAVAALADGTLLVAWTETSAPGDPSDTGVRARIFGADGMPRGEPFLVNTTTDGAQSRPAVAGAADRFLVAFESAGSVRARGFSNAGVPSRNREQPPTDRDYEVAPAGAAPSVAAIGSGALQSWWTVYQAGDPDVLGRRIPL